ncbi:ribose-phosphate pyrophosphokinase [Mycoplasmoides fastidiosum]|uniref:Ribose-phosphate pyrophosphokinase n=1 Tax=Mycoplasmoides fastidiosum TaxID=92758 RepID=A0ABU0LZM7_9BACT|nr:ribose-phosphate pyrophosphokinase [Mycoplasmoides fastidiosum]MDQ0514156.1 ribose-phosphate pyrophosphokinase [Mycoplasmoides fastidiosum]UUD37436.1 ribose-phosphate pyrophosphokinase [Mycoplasmoides fastidiosum]
MKNNNCIVFGLPGCEKLAELVCQKLNLEKGEVDVQVFSDGEFFCRPLASVRNKKVILLQSTCDPVNDNLMTLLITIDALKRASAQEINVLIPYYGYARQDRKTKGREPITAKLVADLLSVAGATRVMLMDVHSSQIQGFFNVPVDTLRATYLLVKEIKKNCNLQNLCIVSPDYGGIKRAREISDVLKVPLVIVDKKRPAPNMVQIENILGDVKNKDCVLVDDMIDTGNTIIKACDILKANGANKIIILATHGVFSGDAVKNFNLAYDKKHLDAIYVTNTINTVYEKPISGLKIVDLSAFFADLIEIYIKGAGSISGVYQKYRSLI